MRYDIKSSFIRSLKKQPSIQKAKIKKAIKTLVIFFETGQKPDGLGLKQLQKNFWEIRVDIKIRIIFRFSEDLVGFITFGNHDEIKRFLRKI